MATINYTTLQLPEILWKFTEVIQDLSHFEVRKYKHKKGIIFRMPKGLEAGQTCHAFMEHEINLSNTLRTGTLTMKVQITFIPCHMGVFSGFDQLRGDYKCDWEDEGYGYEHFVPDYTNPGNIKNIVPLPPNFKTNLYEYLNEILFSHVSDADVISKYAVDLGCQRNKIRDKLVPVPVLSNDTNRGKQVHQQTIDFFSEITSGAGQNLLPPPKTMHTVNPSELLPTEENMENKIADTKAHQKNESDDFKKGYEFGFKHCYSWIKRIVTLFD